jgi:two-component system, NtrC family, response regulator AtoC
MEKPFKIFVVEDNDWYNKLIVHTLLLDPDYQVEAFFSAAELLKNLNKNPDLITLDYQLPDMKGMELLRKIKDFNSDIEVVVISEQENIDTAVELLKTGAYDYIVKEKTIRERLLNTVRNVRENVKLKDYVSELSKEVEQKYDFNNTIIGESPALKKSFDLIKKATETNINVMITGETGTGKELVAKAIHYNSKRKNKPIVSINMAAVPADLVESELFGHEKGAFTGATYARKGKFEEANNGTIFLDEIGELELNLQAKILRVLQEMEVTPLGSNKIIKIDCRIIVATNKNLKEEVKKGKFREDLYYRLLGLTIDLPPLRERDKDVLLLAKHFIKDFCKKNDLKEKTLDVGAKKKLLSYNFPGNVRELKSIVDLATVMSDTDEISAQDIILSSDDYLPEIRQEQLSLREYTYRIIQLCLKETDNNISLAAQKLDISQSKIYRFIKDGNIKID